jgi:hypothetical protein
MIIIKLDKNELDLCKYIGEQRSIIARSNNIFDAKIGIHDGIESDIQGFKAEYAFAKHMNLFPDFGLSPRSGSCDGITKKGFKYDIKSTHHKNGNLICTLKINKDVDIYILAYVHNDIVEFIGWAYNTDLIKDENIKDLGHGKVYFLSREKLKMFNTFK